MASDPTPVEPDAAVAERAAAHDAPRAAPVGTIQPQQARSRRTAERITAAAVELMAERGAGDFTVQEVAQRAGVSIGSFYGRFASKDALVQYLHGTVIDGVVAETRDALSVEAAQGLSAEAVVRTYVSIAVKTFRRHRGIIQQLSLRSRTSPDPAFRHRVLELNIELHELFRQRLYERASEIAHPDPRPAIDIGLTAISAVMREYVLFGDYRPHFAPIDDALLIDELCSLCAAYLRIQS